MEEEDWFQATGPATVGFNTHGTHIKHGGSFVGTETGALGSGAVVGVAGRGVGDGRGGRFEAEELTPQVMLVPDPIGGNGRAREVQPSQLVDVDLPREGTMGDLYMVAGIDAEVSIALWLCVANGDGGQQAAQWCQVLLGGPVEGTISKA